MRAQLGLPRIRQVLERGRPLQGQTSATVARVVVGIIDDGCAFAHPELAALNGKSRVRFIWDQDSRREDIGPHARWTQPTGLGYGRELRSAAIDGVTDESRGDAMAAYAKTKYARFRLEPESHATAPFDAVGQRLPLGSQQRSSHGFAVTALAAGLTSPQAQEQPAANAERVPEWDTEKLTRLAAAKDVARFDSAHLWGIVFVQLPTLTVADTSGGSLAVHVLDGIRYILDRARQIPALNALEGDQVDYSDNPVVINVSYGALGGGHDGTSILERAIDWFGGHSGSQHAWIVLAAGNAHGSAGHASVDMVPGDRKLLTWRVGPDNPLDSFLEIWLPDHDVRGHALLGRVWREMRLSVQAPDAGSLLDVGVGTVQHLRRALPPREGDRHPRTRLIAAVTFARRTVQSEIGTVILLSVAPTRISPQNQQIDSAAPHGEWVITLNWGLEAQRADAPKIRVHAWSERSDLLFGNERGQQNQVFGDQAAGEFSEHDPENLIAWKQGGRGYDGFRDDHRLRPSYSLSSVASIGPKAGAFELVNNDNRRGRAVVVGAYRRNDGEVSEDSSGGAARNASANEVWGALAPGRRDFEVLSGIRSAPDVDAPGDLSPAVRGVRTSAHVAGGTSRISGTSAAAAQVTRAIANVQFVEQLVGDAKQIATTLFPPVVLHKDHEALLAQRPTLTPRQDDAFRRGKRRLSKQPGDTPDSADGH